VPDDPSSGSDDALSDRVKRAVVSQDIPERPPTGGLVAALNVPRNAALGFLAGAMVAAGAYLFRVFEVAGPFGGTREYPVLGAEGWFVLLAVVLAAALGLLVTTLLTLVSAYRLAKRT
jgi:hypothetical protein